jgi:hypothetical protein
MLILSSFQPTKITEPSCKNELENPIEIRIENLQLCLSNKIKK